MMSFEFIEDLLIKIFEADLLDNKNYREILEKMKLTIQSQEDLNTINLLINYIDKDFDSCFEKSKIIFKKESDLLSNINYTIHIFIYYLCLLRLSSKGDVKLNELIGISG